jgi:hypothetical protein
MILEVRYGLAETHVRIFDAAGGIPQSLKFNLSSSRECESLADFIHKLRPSRVEVIDPANTPFTLIDVLIKLKVPYDIFIADAGLLGAHKAQYVAVAGRSLATHKSEIGVRHKRFSNTAVEPREQDWVGRWQKIAEGAQQILVPCPQAEAFVARILPQRTTKKIERCGPSRARRRSRKAAPNQLGFVLVRSCAQEQSLIGNIARKIAEIRPAISTTIMGAALDDIALMGSTDAFVTGSIDAAELDDLVDALGLGYLLVAATQPLFGHPILKAAAQCSLPTAYFDWSAGQTRPKKKDLPLDPQASLDDIIDRLGRWIP